jgi:hypothetical protein
MTFVLAGCLSNRQHWWHLCWRSFKWPASTNGSVLAGRQPASTKGHFYWLKLLAGAAPASKNRFQPPRQIISGLVRRPRAWVAPRGRAASQVTSSSRDCAASRASPSSSTGASLSSSARYGLGAHGRPILRRRGQPDICPRSARMASHPDDFV